jgi:DNA helicase-2/ATP-dependent DNA helicase PcrA
LDRIGEDAKRLTIGTIHAWCASCLRKFGHHIGYKPNFTILDEDEQASMLLRIAKEYELDWKTADAKALAGVMDDCREKLMDAAEMQRTIEATSDGNGFLVVEEYLKQLQQKHRLDFSGLLTETYRLLKEKKEVLDIVQNRFQYIQIDESQDTNPVQFSIIELVGGLRKNIFLVADVDQSIYAFRGARPANITDFIRNYNPRIIRLGQNYRSTPQIVTVADRLIRLNPNRPADDFRTSNPSGPKVECKAFDTSEDESRWIAWQIKEAIRQGVNPKRIAILYRLNRMSRSLEEELIHLQIPYAIIGGMSFFDRQEVKDHLAFLKLLNNPHDEVSFERIINRPKRGIGEVGINKISSLAQQLNVNLLEACKSDDLRQSYQSAAKDFASAFDFDWRTKPIAEVIHTISDRIRYKEGLEDRDLRRRMERMENVQELCNFASRFGIAGERMAGFLDHIALMTSVDKSNKTDAVTLMTLHCSKGLEYQMVFMPGVEQGTLPHKLSVDENKIDGIQEERRLCYVGMTRSERHLCLSYCRWRSAAWGGGSMEPCEPSQFLFESGLLKRQDDPEQVALNKAYEGAQ